MRSVSLASSSIPSTGATGTATVIAVAPAPRAHRHAAAMLAPVADQLTIATERVEARDVRMESGIELARLGGSTIPEGADRRAERRVVIADRPDDGRPERRHRSESELRLQRMPDPPHRDGIELGVEHPRHLDRNGMPPWVSP